MEEKKNLLTYAGLKKLEDELHDLKVVKRKEVAGKIKEAREQGDLSENAEYDAAKDEQRDIEARIEEIEKILKNAEVVVEDEVDLDKINVGCKVKVHDYEFDEDMELKIVGSTEANSLEGKISNESPVGKALIGAHTGDVVDVEMPILAEIVSIGNMTNLPFLFIICSLFFSVHDLPLQSSQAIPSLSAGSKRGRHIASLFAREGKILFYSSLVSARIIILLFVICIGCFVSITVSGSIFRAVFGTVSAVHCIFV